MYSRMRYAFREFRSAFVFSSNMLPVKSRFILTLLVASAATNPVERPAETVEGNVQETVVVKENPVYNPSRDARHLSPEINDIGESAIVSDNKGHDVQVIGAQEKALLDKLDKKCGERDVSSCVMLKMVGYVNRLLKKSSIVVGDGIEISQRGEDVAEDDTPRAQTNDYDFTQMMSDKMWGFVKSRSLKWNLISGTDLVMSSNLQGDGVQFALRASEQGRKKNNFGPILAAVGAKIGILAILAFKGLVLLVLKALVVSKIALVLAVIIGLKKLFSGQKQVTYEVVAHPHESHHESYGSSGWARSSDPQQLAYKAYAPVSQQ